MSNVRVQIGVRDTTVHLDDRCQRVPIGIDVISNGELHSDPPRPEELINAIGAVIDHLDDVVRELPDVLGREVEVNGAEMAAIAGVEVGGLANLPFVLSRSAAEDVFRTLATESDKDRRLNPGLPVELVRSVVAGCCLLVGLMRRLHLEHVWVVE